MTSTLYALPIALVLGSAAIAQQNAPLSADAISIVTATGSNRPVAIRADLTDLEQALVKALTDTAVNNPCGDRVRTDGVDFTGQGETAIMTANLHYSRYQCVTIPETVCKAFTCEVKERTTRELVYKSTLPVTLKISARTQEKPSFQVTWDESQSYTKELLGNDQYFTDVARNFAAQTQKNLDGVTDQLSAAWQSGGARTDATGWVPQFKTQPDGSLGLVLKPSR